MAVDRRTGATQQELGREGEDLAAQHLEQQGCTVLARNWRSRAGELDIIASRGTLLIVCEVKTRSGTGFGVPAESVTRTKIARIRRLAQQWQCTYHRPWGPVRFDVISVLFDEDGQAWLEHIEGAF
ncbi:YraN family protein [Haloechinothrix halophila]|uniref:YraN family protein n=1 Tax=Haloechinothrix halophila TaxID=1069073 RepID=UPI0004173F59|nr:YraN family protein [Haloechinothrix halophila]